MTNPNTVRPIEMIAVPICNDCNLPHVGRSDPHDRCWCDTVGNWHWGEIEKEEETR